MNLALGGLLILLLILPGILFRLFLIKSESFENPLDTSTAAELVYMFVPAVFFHCIGFYVTPFICDCDIVLEQLYFLIVGPTDSNSIDFATIVTPSFLPYFKYLFVMCLVGACIGFLLKKIVLMFFLDFKFKSLSITNEWDDLFSGRLFIYEQRELIWEDFVEYFKRLKAGNMSLKRFYIYSKILYADWKYIQKVIHYIVVDTLVQIDNTQILYKGVIEKYFVSKGNKLDKLYLSGCIKKEHKLNCEPKPTFEEITSDVLVINGEHIINVNINYKYID